MADTADTPTEDEPQAGTPEAPPEGAGNGTPDPQSGTDERDDPRIAALSREAAKYRTALRKAEQELEERKRAEMSEAERLAADVATLRAQLDEANTARIRDARRADVLAAASAARFVDPEAAWVFLRDDATGDDFDPKAAVAALGKERKYLVQSVASGADASASRAAGSGDKPETLEERRARIYGSSAADAWGDPAKARAAGGGVFFNTRLTEGGVEPR